MISPRPFLTTLLIAAATPAIACANPAARPGDDALTCAQIGAEMMPSVMAMGGAFDAGDSLDALSGRAAEGAGVMARATAGAGACLAADAATQAASMGTVEGRACDAAYAEANAFNTKMMGSQAAAENDRITENLTSSIVGVQAMAGQLDMDRLEHLSALAEAKGCN